MQRIQLKGHERPITRVLFNKENDLLFTCAKDVSPSVWRTSNGERIGSYEGHQGSVWDCDVNKRATLLITGSGDGTAKIWNVQHGKCLQTISPPGSRGKAVIRSVQFATSDHFFSIVQDNSFSARPTLFIYNNETKTKLVSMKDPSCSSKDKKEKDSSKDLPAQTSQGSVVVEAVRGPVRQFASQKACITRHKWRSVNREVIWTKEDGGLTKWDVNEGILSQVSKENHQGKITDLYMTPDETMLLTTSLDCKAKLWDARTLTCIKTYSSLQGLNAGVISPKFNHVLVAGGQDAKDVTQSLGSGNFQIEFYHLIYMDFLGQVTGHFGPVNSLAIMSDGSGYASGSEDGYVYLNKFDSKYMDSTDLFY